MAGKQFPLSVIIRAVDKVTAPIGAIQRRILGMDRAIRGRFAAFSNGLGLPVLTAATGRLGGALGDLGSRLAKVTGGAAALVATATAGGLALVQQFADAGGEINDTARSIGISAEALQEFRYAAKQNGVEAELLDNSLGILNKNLGKAFRGKGPADLLKGLRINLKGANGEFKTVDKLLPEIADKLAGIQNPALRASAAAELLGKGGGKLLPMLLDGSAGLAKYAARARELGIVIDNKTIGSVDEFGDAMDDAKGALTGARNTIGTVLLPVLAKLTKQFTDWLVKIRPQLQAWFSKFAAELPGRIEQARQAFDQLVGAVRPVLTVVGWLVEKFGAGNVAAAAIATALAIFLIPAVYSTVTALYALGVAILTTPIGWILGLIMLLAAGALLVWKNWDKLAAFFSDWWGTVSAIFGAVVDFLAGVWDDATSGFKSGFIDGLVTLWKTLNPVALIIRAFTELGPRLVAIVAPYAARVMEFFGGMVPDWAKGMLGISGSAPSLGAAPVGAAATGQRAVAAQNGSVRVAVDLNGLPPGSRVRSEEKGRPGFELNQGFATGGAF